MKDAGLEAALKVAGGVAALAAALGWASGLRLYAVVFLTGAAGFMGWLPLPPGLQILQNPLVLGASFLLFVVEFVADKIPAVDSLWDTVHTFIRIPAGAALAAGALGAAGAESGWLGADSTTWSLIAALAGGSLAATAHAAKATTRAAVNTSPEPFSNVLLSLAGDAAVPLMLWLAPLILVLMAASSWLKRLGVPVVLVGGGVAVAVLAKAYDITWPLQALQGLGERINHTLVYDARSLGEALNSEGSSLVGWALKDYAGTLAELASLQFVGWAAVAAAAFALIVIKRARGG